MDDARGPGIDTPAGYTGLRRIGAGPEADLYQAWDEHAREWVVLRLLHGYVAGRRQEEDFADRYAAAARLGGHPGIVPVRAGGVTATGRAWLATDLVQGGTLADALRIAPLPLDRALALAAVLADALAWAHATHPPMTHGRIDAGQVLFGPDGGPKLTGFALAAGRHSPRGDVAALATLLFHMLTGRTGITAAALVLPPDLAGVPGLGRLLVDGLTTSSAAEFAYRLRDVAAPRTRAVAFTAPSGTYPVLTTALSAPSGTSPALRTPSGTYPALTTATGAFPALHGPSAAYSVLSDVTSARLMAPASAHSPRPSTPLSPYGQKRRRLAGLAALALILVVGAAAGVLLFLSGRSSPAGTSTPATTAPGTHLSRALSQEKIRLALTVVIRA